MIYENIEAEAFKRKMHCVKSVQIQSFFWSLFSCIRTEYKKYGPEKTLYLDTFHTVMTFAKEMLYLVYRNI